MEYLPKRSWSTLEKKRDHIMIKAIDKLQKERRMMRSLKNRHGPNDAMHNPSQPLKVGKTLFQNSRRFTHFYRLSYSELVGIEKIDTPAGNPVKEILLKLNLPDHRSTLTDSKVTPTKHERMTKPYSSSNFIANCVIAYSLKDGHGASLSLNNNDELTQSTKLTQSRVSRHDDERVLISEVLVRNKDGEELERKDLVEEAVKVLKMCRPNSVLTVHEVQEDVHRIIGSGYFSSCLPVAVDTRDGIRLVFEFHCTWSLRVFILLHDRFLEAFTTQGTSIPLFYQSSIALIEFVDHFLQANNQNEVPLIPRDELLDHIRTLRFTFRTIHQRIHARMFRVNLLQLWAYIGLPIREVSC
ncbi:outer envelope protein 80, chloroplastic [Tanacetum coccineum]